MASNLASNLASDVASSPDFSLIIPTYNRAELAVRAVRSIAEVDLDDPARLEVIVVDNNGTDNTGEAVLALRDQGFPFDLLVLRETRQGVSHARNRGIAEARGGTLVFMDDDQLIARDYFRVLERAFAETGAACLGGKILYYNADKVAAWLKPLVDDIGQIDMGDERFEATTGEHRTYVREGNMAIGKPWLDRVGGFDGSLGRRGDTLLGGEGFELQDRIIAAGGRVFYVPDLMQYHYLRPERLHKRYWRKHAFDWGRSEYEMEKANWAGANRFLGAPRTLWLYLLTGSLRRYMASLMTFNGAAVFNRELAIWQRMGYIAEARRQHREGG